jgi:hypothetical protein
LAVEIEGPNHDFYVYDFARGVMSKMTTNGLSHWPVWSPDGKEIGFRSGPMGKFTMWRMPADRSAPSQQVLPASTMAQSLESWSPDGRNLVYTEMSLQSGSNVLILPPDGKPLRLGEPATRSATASMAMAAGGMPVPPPVASSTMPAAAQSMPMPSGNTASAAMPSQSMPSNNMPSQASSSAGMDSQSIPSQTMPTGGMPVQNMGQSARSMQKMVQVGSPKFSPDGRWISYCSDESGMAQVYVQSFPGPGPKIQVSDQGGADPVWKRNGGELFYRDGDKMMAVTVSTTPTFTAERSRLLWEGHYSHGMSASCGPPGATSSNYDVTADGKRFLMIKDNDQDRASSKQIVVAPGWANELRRMAGRA